MASITGQASITIAAVTVAADTTQHPACITTTLTREQRARRIRRWLS
jgi:hypothetical protein